MPAAAEAGAGMLDLGAFGSADDLATLGADAIKDALGKMGLKQGGTDEQRRERLYSTRGKSLAEVDKKLFTKGAAPAKDSDEAARREAAAKDIARAEGLVERLLEHLSAVVDGTKGNVEKKATLSLVELEAEVRRCRLTL